MRKINVGMTVHISKPTESFFSNGLKQNVITFLETFSCCPNVGDVYLINLGSQKDLSESPWKIYEKHIIDFDTALSKLDLAITVGASFTDPMLESLRSKGIKIVRDVLGTDYHFLAEDALFNLNRNLDYKRRKHHVAVWISPHIFPANKDLQEIVCDAPAYVAPFVWSPQFLENSVAEYKKTTSSSGFYEPKEKEKRISSFEPNVQLVKTCITPIIIAEKFYRRAPELVKNVRMFASLDVKKSNSLAQFVTSLEVHKNKKISFEARYSIAWALLEHTDIVISHQRDLALNYLYFDAAWLGFPIIHNAHFVKELGYYYEDFDAEQAANLLVDVAQNFDSQKDEYLKRSREYISRFLPNNKENVNGYAELIEAAMK